MCMYKYMDMYKLKNAHPLPTPSWPHIGQPPRSPVGIREDSEKLSPRRTLTLKKGWRAFSCTDEDKIRQKPRPKAGGGQAAEPPAGKARQRRQADGRASGQAAGQQRGRQAGRQAGGRAATTVGTLGGGQSTNCCGGGQAGGRPARRPEGGAAARQEAGSTGPQSLKQSHSSLVLAIRCVLVICSSSNCVIYL